LASLKPTKSIFGIIGVVFFFIVPEIIAFMYGAEITSYASDALVYAQGYEKYYYELLIMLFESGGSWFGLAIGIALLVWLFL
jgi:hypothetical protein